MMQRWRGSAIRDIGIAVFLATLLGILLLNMLAPEETNLTYLMMTGLSFICVIFGFLGFPHLMVVLAAILSGAWTIYKLFIKYAEGQTLIFPFDHLWVIAPVLLIVGVAIFLTGSSRVVRENELLIKQVEEAVFVDALTGLQNLRAMYHEFPKMISHSKRYKQPLTLTLITLRHEQELRAFLSESQYHALLQLFADMVFNVVRMEDRLYSIDDKGSLALLAISDSRGMEAIERRLRAVLSVPDVFIGVTGRELKVAVRIAYLVYPNDSSLSPFEFKQAVEACLAYDV